MSRSDSIVKDADLLYEPAGTEVAVGVKHSIIIVNYNGLEYIGPCLEAFLLHTDDETEIIVVDNASTDDSVNYLRLKYPSVRVICSDNNSGYGSGNNLGVEHALGRYLVFVNPDTVVQSDFLKPLIDVLESDSTIGMTTSKILLLNNPQQINTCGNQTHFTGLTLCRGMGKPASDFSQQAEVGAVSGAAFAMSRKLYEHVGGFDPALFMYMDDTDLSWRVRQAGYKCVYVPNSIVYHDYILHFGPRKTYFQERNRYVMLLKTLHWASLAILFLPLMIAEMVTWGFVLLRERTNFRNKIDAYYWVWKHWSSIMEERRRVRSMRRVSDRALIKECGYWIEFEQTGHDSLVSLSHFVFDPVFWVFYNLAIFLIRW